MCAEICEKDYWSPAWNYEDPNYPVEGKLPHDSRRFKTEQNFAAK